MLFGGISMNWLNKIMDLFINLHETIGVSDHVKAETEIDAVIYRQEFELVKIKIYEHKYSRRHRLSK